MVASFELYIHNDYTCPYKGDFKNEVEKNEKQKIVSR